MGIISPFKRFKIPPNALKVSTQKTKVLKSKLFNFILKNE
ncbi:hypothetical protein N201_06260 [Helicobacter pylori UM066]|nr:hypothetical protein N201_06260 [Helicobacter pylori UM066]